jgi:hypothetical protein
MPVAFIGIKEKNQNIGWDWAKENLEWHDFPLVFLFVFFVFLVST